MSRNPLHLISSLVLFLVISVLILGWGIYRKNQLDNSSRLLAITTTDSVFTSGTADQLVANAHQSLLAEMSSESLNAYLNSVKQILGPLDAIEAISGTVDVALIPFAGSAPTASFEINLVFADNAAIAMVEMIHEQGLWQITDYNIQSDLLFN